MHALLICQASGKERVICLTAERRTKRRGFKGSLHLCKPGPKGYLVRSCAIRMAPNVCEHCGVRLLAGLLSSVPQAKGRKVETGDRRHHALRLALFPLAGLYLRGGRLICGMKRHTAHARQPTHNSAGA